jgi:ER lumen protein retaining receptor
MNIFQFAADMLHLYSVLLLILKIRSTKNVLGISYRSQEIYMVVFVMRYWDLFLYWVSLYNFVMKIFFLTATAYTIYLMKKKKPYCLVILILLKSYDNINDSFNHYYFIYPCKIIAFYN